MIEILPPFVVRVLGPWPDARSFGQMGLRALLVYLFAHQHLMGALRANANSEDLEQVEHAYLERSGSISIIKRQRCPQVLEVKVEQGVQNVRIELG